MLEVAKSPVAWVNVAFLLAALIVPTVKDLLTPELEVSVVAVVNAVIAMVERARG